MTLRPCPQCRHHVFAHKTACPFCGAAVSAGAGAAGVSPPDLDVIRPAPLYGAPPRLPAPDAYRDEFVLLYGGPPPPRAPAARRHRLLLAGAGTVVVLAALLSVLLRR